MGQTLPNCLNWVFFSYLTVHYGLSYKFWGDTNFIAFIVFFTICLFVWYSIIAFLVNKTDITVCNSIITVKEYPLSLPFSENKNINAFHIKQVYVAKKENTVRRGIRSRPTTFYNYEIMIISNTNESTVLFESIFTPEDAIFIEKKIERYLGIKNSRVEGEYNPNVEL